MYRIFRYPLLEPKKVEYIVEMPEDSVFLSVGLKDGQEINLWYRVKTCTETMLKRKFHVIGTGWPLSDEFPMEYEYKGTVITSDNMVWHIYENIDYKVNQILSKIKYPDE